MQNRRKELFFHLVAMGGPSRRASRVPIIEAAVHNKIKDWNEPQSLSLKQF